MMENPVLSSADRQRVHQAIAAAEARTSGEIFCVLARRSDDYFFPAAFMLATGILITGVIAALALERLWADIGLAAFALSQATAFAAALAVIWLFPALRLHLVPRGLRYRRAHDNAVKQFLAHNVHRTDGRTGVLVFLSLAERYGEIVADAGIATKVAQKNWDDAVARLTACAAEARIADGFVDAVGFAADLLAPHFPKGADNPNELDDHLVEL
ncbi:MAG: TPM domain-containing protein [Nitratireductor sp.]